RGRGPRFGRGGNRPTPEPGRPLVPDDVPQYPDAELYSPDVMRTVFIEFESDDWETELEAFKETDVDVPATVIVDGQTYPGVGVHFRGMSSYMMVPAGFKRSLNLSFDTVDPDQRLYGYKTLNLLNGNGDPSMMSAVLYSELARKALPAPKANFVEVVINGASWGVFANVQQFDKIFTEENFGSSAGTRWKAPGNPGADAGLRYLGDDLDEYEARFEMKSDDGKTAWLALIELCQVLNETPVDQLQEKLEPLLDIDGVLRFLAYDVALANSDGYWTRASDYYLFRDDDGVFHVIPHDMNEAFHTASGGPPPGFGPPGGFGPPPNGFGPPPGSLGPPNGFGPQNGFGPPGDFGPPRESGPPEGFGPPRDFPPPGDFGQPGDFGPPEDAFGARPDGDAPQRRGRGNDRRGPRRGFGPHGGGPDLDPLVGIDDDRMPLRSRLLKIPELRERYLQYVRDIAEQQLDWAHLGPRVQHYRDLIAPVVEQDTRKTSTTEAFLKATAVDGEATDSSLRGFAEQRSKFLSDYEIPSELQTK
ncbi:MAG: CotH kinase family protein, partial [Planctomycetales bacterium]|nr:CotH kinase family protein [Planctomycetales bacterium]